MAEWSGPFDTTTDLTEARWRKLQREAGIDGILADYGSTALTVTVGADTNSVDVTAGDARVQGTLYENTATLNKAVSSNGAGSARPDRLVLRYDATANSITAVVVTGTAGAGAPPALTQVATGQWEIPVARWTRGASGGAITGILDERWLVSGDAWTIGPSIGFPTPPRVGQRLLQRGTGVEGREYRWSGAFWERTDPGPLLSVVDTTASGPTTTSWAALAGPSGTFTAPMSGRVKVHISAFITSPASAGDCGYTARVTGPGGVDSTPATDSPDQCQLGGGNGDTRVKSSDSFYVSGLTAGSVYTATGLGRVTSPSGHQRIENKRIIVERA